jgi:SNF2 family DNA or RNA helicase
VKNARLTQPLDNGWTLFSHQKKAILQALLMRRMILALDMGLGKTLIGCVWARAFQKAYGDGLKVICVCPVSLTAEWKRTALEATGIVVEEVGTGKNNSKPDPDSVLMQICSWAKIPDKVPSSIQHYVVVCDEAHSMQSLEAARTKAVLNLSKSSRCVGVLLLSGTPLKNGKPKNLFPLLKAVRHPFGDNRKAYEQHFCDGRDKSFGRGRSVWDANGASNLGQLREHISTHLLHMTKEECLGDTIPAQTRVIRQVPVSSKHQLQHNQALSKLAAIYASTGKLEDAGDAVLTAVTRVRQIGSFAKISATVAITSEVLQEQPW